MEEAASSATLHLHIDLTEDTALQRRHQQVPCTTSTFNRTKASTAPTVQVPGYQGTIETSWSSCLGMSTVRSRATQLVWRSILSHVSICTSSHRIPCWGRFQASILPRVVTQRCLSGTVEIASSTCVSWSTGTCHVASSTDGRSAGHVSSTSAVGVDVPSTVGGNEAPQRVLHPYPIIEQKVLENFVRKGR